MGLSQTIMPIANKKVNDEFSTDLVLRILAYKNYMPIPPKVDNVWMEYEYGLKKNKSPVYRTYNAAIRQNDPDIVLILGEDCPDEDIDDISKCIKLCDEEVTFEHGKANCKDPLDIQIVGRFTAQDLGDLLRMSKKAKKVRK